MDIFISHSSKDEPIAKALIDLIRCALSIKASNIRCTSVEGYKMPIGVSVDDRIKQEVYESRVFIAILTSNSLSSQYVLFEMGARWGTLKPFYPIIAEKGIVELLEAPIKNITSSKSYESGDMFELVRHLADELSCEIENTAVYNSSLQKFVQLTSSNSFSEQTIAASHTDTLNISEKNYFNEANELSYESKELLIAAIKIGGNKIVRNPNEGYFQISVNHHYFGVTNIDESVQRYYHAIDLLNKKRMINPISGDYVYLNTTGMEKAEDLLLPLDEYPFTALLEITDKFNQINNNSFPDEKDRVDEKRNVAHEMYQFIKDYNISTELVHYSLIGEKNQGKLVALMKYILETSFKQYIPYIYSHYKKAAEPFSKHSVLDVIEKFASLHLFIKTDFKLCNRILTEYDNIHDNELHKKILRIRNLLK